ncbi:radical SAM protein [Terrisporobacter sp.]
MHYTGRIFRPPTEAYTPLLQVTVGCSHNKCAFCTMYSSVQFNISKDEEIIEDLIEIRNTYGNVERIYLLNGDPFVLAIDKLLHISDLIHQYLPSVKSISCYASIRDIQFKSAEDIKKLQAAGFKDIYIGIETAYGPTLEMINKGCTVEDELEALQKLQDAGMYYHASIMAGIAGKENSKEHVKATVDLLNKYQPKMIGFMPTAVVPGSDLEKLRDNGEYHELNNVEILEEELMFLKGLNLADDVFWFGSHPFNNISISGYFKEKESMIQELERALAYMSER